MSYLRYIIQNIQPMRIADASQMQSGQSGTLNYIPGSTIRGLVINHILQGRELKEKNDVLFSESIAFLNAYLTTSDKTLIPSPKGFYEDKRDSGSGTKEIQSVVINGDFTEGYKRARLGSCCHIDNGCIYYYDIQTGSNLRIAINTDKRALFRSNYINPGYCFEGYIKLSGHEETDAKICDVLKTGEEVIIGNSRSSGTGRCRIIRSEVTEAIPYMDSAFDADGEAYVMLLSDTVLRNQYGELSGFDLSDVSFREQLKHKLGVDKIKEVYASTSVRHVYGYNRTMGTRLPTVPAYEAGSIFHITFDGTISKETMQAICSNGIGIRKNEGFGRILFLKAYEEIKYKKFEVWEWDSKDHLEKADLTETQQKTLRAIARRYYDQKIETAMERYIVMHPIKGNPGAGLKGTVDQVLTAKQFQYNEAYATVAAIIDHDNSRRNALRTHKENETTNDFGMQVLSILENSITDTLTEGLKVDDPTALILHRASIMGVSKQDIFSTQDDQLYRIRLLMQMLKYSRKGADK